MQIAGHAEPPRILQIYREPLKPGSEAAYHEIEVDAARICARLGCPHPYLGIEALTGAREVWFFNGYESLAEHAQVVEDYTKNTRLLEALGNNSKRKAALTTTATEVFANYRQDVSRGVRWLLGRGRFLVITVTRSDRKIDGTVFEAPDGTRFIVMAAQTRHDADAAAALARAGAGTETTIFAVRREWSLPATEWIAADPEFWGARSPAARP